MGEKNCNHEFGIWFSDNDLGYRICNICSCKQMFPMDEKIRKQINKQKNAKMFFEKFIEFDGSQEDIVDVVSDIDALFDYAFCFVDKDLIVRFFNKIRSLGDYIDEESYLGYMDMFEQWNKGNIDDFWDMFDEIKEFHAKGKGYSR